MKGFSLRYPRWAVVLLTISVFEPILAQGAEVATRPADSGQAVGSDATPLSHWESVDLVNRMEDFRPERKRWSGDLFLKEFDFLPDGKTSLSCRWEKDWLIDSKTGKRFQYAIKEMNGVSYLFLPWAPSGSAETQGPPSYYVLKKSAGRVLKNFGLAEHEPAAQPASSVSVRRRLPLSTQPAKWKDNKIVSRVLPYPDFNSFFVRLPIAHAAATGKGVKVAVISSSPAGSVLGAVMQIAPGCEAKAYARPKAAEAAPTLAREISSAGCRVAAIPDIDAWSEETATTLAKELIKDEILVVVPSDLSEDEAKVKAVNALHVMGVFTVGRVNRQSMVTELADKDEESKAYNRRIREIDTDLFSTTQEGMSNTPDRTLPVATAASVAALVLEKWPNLKAAEVGAKMLAGARRVWQMTDPETGRRARISVDPVTSKDTPFSEKEVFRFRVLDAAGSLGVDTAIPWFLNMLNCQKAWEITKGQGVVAVVSDQGFHIRHPDLANRIKRTAEFGPKSLNEPEQNFHGTEMSRVLLSVAPEARIIPVLCSARANSDRFGPEKSQNIARSFRFAVEQKVDIVSASWAGPYSQREEILAAIRETADKGVVVSWFHFPESHPGVLRSTICYLPERDGDFIGFADRFLVDQPGFHHVEIEAGLSDTAPQLAGIAALAKSVNPQLTPPQIEALIRQNSTPIDGGVLIPDAYRIVLAAKQKR